MTTSEEKPKRLRFGIRELFVATAAFAVSFAILSKVDLAIVRKESFRAEMSAGQIPLVVGLFLFFGTIAALTDWMRFRELGGCIYTGIGWGVLLSCGMSFVIVPILLHFGFPSR